MKTNNAKKAEIIRNILFVVIGVLSIIFAINIGGLSTGNFEMSFSYGGDAYTGIQNACAGAANNAIDVANILQQGFEYCLIIAGFVLVSIGGTSLCKLLETKPQAIDTPAEEKSQPESSDCVTAE